MPKGGRREGAGRKIGTGKLGEPTMPVRMPKRLALQIPEIIAVYDCQEKLKEQLQEVVNEWDKKTAYPESSKSSSKKLARQLWLELKAMLELCT